MERRVELGVKDRLYYTLHGEAEDVEAILRLRGWMEDEVAAQKGSFSRTALTVLDYDAQRKALGFTIEFFR